VEALENICKEAFKNFKDKEDYTNYLFVVKKIYHSLLFRSYRDLGQDEKNKGSL